MIIYILLLEHDPRTLLLATKFYAHSKKLLSNCFPTNIPNPNVDNNNNDDNNNNTSNNQKKVIDIISLGIGSFSQSKASLHQLALVLLLAKDLEVRTQFHP